MKEMNFGLIAFNLLDAATALAGILDQTIERNCVTVGYQYAARLICEVQNAAKIAADELMLIHFDKEDEPYDAL